MKISAIIVAGGKGKRMGAKINKLFLPFAGKEIIAHTIAAFDQCCDIDEIIIAARPEDCEQINNIIERENIQTICNIVHGGAERQNSVYNGLLAASGDFAAIHDAARCLITPDEISSVISDAVKFGAAAAGVSVKDTLKSIDSAGNIIGTIDREKTVHIQTPQVFPLNDILRLHKMASEEGISVTDDCSVFEHYGMSVHLTECSYDNIKITTPEDIYIGEKIFNSRK